MRHPCHVSPAVLGAKPGAQHQRHEETVPCLSGDVEVDPRQQRDAVVVLNLGVADYRSEVAQNVIVHLEAGYVLRHHLGDGDRPAVVIAGDLDVLARGGCVEADCQYSTSRAPDCLLLLFTLHCGALSISAKKSPP